MNNPSFSHPDNSVRHSYALNVKNASIGTSVVLLMKTIPYIAMRMTILMVWSIIAIIACILAFGGFAYLGKHVHPVAGMIWWVGILGGLGAVYQFFGRYALYLIKCGHIAVLTELITTGRIDNGNQGMFSYGKKIVTEKFGQVNILFVVDSLITGVVRAFNRSLDWIGSLIPVPGLDSITNIINAILFAATTYIDETIFSYNLARGDANPWRSSKDGLIYYAQNAKPILKTAVWAVILDKVLSVFLWIVLLIPAFILVRFIPYQGLSIVAFVIALLFAMNIRSALLKPLFLIMIMTRFHTEAEGQTINMTWDSRLTGISDKFKELKIKATGHGDSSESTSESPVLA